MKKFQLEEGLRYRLEDSILREGSPFHQETKFFAISYPEYSTVEHRFILYEARSRFAYEVVSPDQAVLWELKGEIRSISADKLENRSGMLFGTRFAISELIGELNWVCNPSHILSAEQCTQCSSFVTDEDLGQIERDARKKGAVGAPLARKVGVTLRDRCDYFDPSHKHWHVRRLKSVFLKRPVWVLYETCDPYRVLQTQSNGSICVWLNGTGIKSTPGSLNVYKPEEQLWHNPLPDMGLRPLQESPGLKELCAAITKRNSLDIEP